MTSFINTLIRSRDNRVKIELNHLKTWALGEILQEPVQSVQLRKEPSKTKINYFFAEEPSLFFVTSNVY